MSSYRAQKRGGRGVIGMTTREGETTEDNDFVQYLFTASTHDYLMFFTNTGRVYVERVHEIPDMVRTAKGRSIANLLELKAEEKVAAMIRIQSKTNDTRADTTWSQPGYLFFTTQQGTVKKTALEEFGNVRKGGMSIRFPEEDVRNMGRPAGGVKGITLDAGDAVVAAAIVVADATLLVAGENGIGKRTAFDEYRAQSRGGKGIITMKTGDKTGGVIGALTVRDQDEIMLITVGGQMVRTSVKDIREAGRNTMGVKLVNLDASDKLQAIAPVVVEEQQESAIVPTPPVEPAP